MQIGRLLFPLTLTVSFPPYSEDDLLTMEYSLGGRFHSFVHDDMDARKFVQYFDLLQKDILEENRQREHEAMKAGRR